MTACASCNGRGFVTYPASDGFGTAVRTCDACEVGRDMDLRDVATALMLDDGFDDARVFITPTQSLLDASQEAADNWRAEAAREAARAERALAERDAAVTANADLGARLALAFAAMTEAAGELRHAYYNPDVIDRNLVARAIALLERAGKP